MDIIGQSCLKTETKEFILEAYGKNKKEAVAAVFTKLKKEVYSSTDGLIIHMEPEDVILLKEEEKTSVQKFLGFFAPKEIQDYHIQLKVIVRVKYI
ncbi:MAG: DUF4312 family protein [Angelakisella sp.]|nr:DUF4312 family protein [Angelakisella sp.]